MSSETNVQSDLTKEQQQQLQEEDIAIVDDITVLVCLIKF